MTDEESLFAAVAQEVERGEIRTGLWAKALAEERYDERGAKAKYLRLRVAALRSELRVERQIAKQQARAEAAQQNSARGYAVLAHSRSLDHLRKRRSQGYYIGFAAFFFPSALIACFAVIFPEAWSTATRVTVGAASAFGLGMVGVFLSAVVMFLIPSMRELERQESVIRAELEHLKGTKKSFF